jgi:hypothetical protein
MGKAKAISIDLQDSRLERGGESSLCPTACCRLDKAHGRVGERCNYLRKFERISSKATQALVNEPFKSGGNRQLLAGIQPAAALKRARELDGEERISARHFPDAQEGWPWEDRADARSQHLAQRADAEWA